MLELPGWRRDLFWLVCMSGKQAARGTQECVIALRNDSLAQESTWHASFLHPHIRAKQSTSSRVNTEAQGAWQSQHHDKEEKAKLSSLYSSHSKSAAQLPLCPSTTHSSSTTSILLLKPTCLFSSTPSCRSYLTAVNWPKLMYLRLNKEIQADRNKHCLFVCSPKVHFSVSLMSA